MSPGRLPISTLFSDYGAYLHNSMASLLARSYVLVLYTTISFSGGNFVAN
jgi:hypothetical protein